MGMERRWGYRVLEGFGGMGIVVAPLSLLKIFGRVSGLILHL